MGEEVQLLNSEIAAQRRGQAIERGNNVFAGVVPSHALVGPVDASNMEKEISAMM